MNTVEDVARQVIASIDSDAGYLLAGQWVVQRYQQMACRVRMRHLREIGELLMPGSITAGLATFTQGSKVVTGDATATATWGAQHIGWHLRNLISWYEIVEYAKVNGVGQFTLRGPYEETSSAAGGGAYTMVQRWLPLDPNAAFLSRTFVHMRRRYPMQMITMDELDRMAPSRPYVGWGPDTIAEASETPDGIKRVEAYPYSTQDESLRYIFWRFVPNLALTDSIPNRVPAYVLKEGALIDLFRYKAGKAADAKLVDQAGYWRNESRAQETKWEQYIREAIGFDRSPDDATFILQKANTPIRAADITTARDQIYSQWPR